MMKKLNKKDKNKKFLLYNFLKKNRRGDDKTTGLIVTFAVLIASFLAILYFIFVLNPTKTSEESVCHNAVLTRSAGVLPKETIPLNCKTDYICLSKDGSCESMTSPEIIKVKTKEEVYKSLAEQGVNCWWMFGEGKLNYIGDKDKSELYCSICSQVVFDDSLNNLFAINPSPVSRASAGIPPTYSNFLIEKEEFYEYLANTNISGKDTTYLNYFLGLQTSKSISDALKSNNYDFGYIDIEKQHFIMMGEFSRVGLLNDIWTGVKKGALLVLVLPIPFIGGLWAESIIISTISGANNVKNSYLIGTIVTGESGQKYLSPTIIEANSEDYSNLNCADIKTLA